MDDLSAVARALDSTLDVVQGLLEDEFPRCAAIQADRHPVASMARCRSHGTHLLSAEACELAIRGAPFRSALGPECEDQIWEYQLLPSSVALIADKIKATPLEWRRNHPCRAPSCPLFVLEDGSCVDKQCSDACPECLEDLVFDDSHNHMT
ncbi:unnamed protein product [Clonostachys solani]|uniref:Uncharacterized protein n=1 Tax=Clonostachys solani TaxID=160281 RepID=A0A9N9Z4R9_9HYPO|nr:unnamed protein product [Clonostachys solani]